jgi:NADPH:quinone reductase-like Zn-dependent oxidoreductase
MYWVGAGTVVDVGTGVWDFKKGDVVWAGAELFRNGAHAEYVAINQVSAFLSFAQLPSPYATSIYSTRSHSSRAG